MTDLQYSSAGDRILTASQRDGEVRIWSWAADPVAVSRRGSVPNRLRHHRPGTDKAQSGRKVSHVFIKLKNPSSCNPTLGRRRRPNSRVAASSSSSSVSCDVAVWTCDDAKIVTSQCELLKLSGTDIVPGSQYLFVWDSFTGNCLLGIAGAHTSQCPAVICHPSDPGIMCSAGADGVVNVWDVEAATSFFTFTNTVDYGPVDPNDSGKASGYLDGSFFPDGTGLVLTDDSGRVTVFDCYKAGNGPANQQAPGAPGWMKEQYFANDYYDLSYDANGYCIERGSEQPPHLAPVGVRCAHGGSPFSDAINEAFRKLAGPIPISVKNARWQRQLVLSKGFTASKRSYEIMAHISVKQYEPTTTVLVRGSEDAVLPSLDGTGGGPSPARQASRSNVQSPRVPRLSSNWRWGDYNDIERLEGNEEEEDDSDDEEFELAAERRSGGRGQQRGRRLSREADSDESEDDLEADSSPDSRARGRRLGRSVLEDLVDSEGEYDEFMSTNNTPSGPFVRDYDKHYFRMPSAASASKLVRQWLLRFESNACYAGRKFYAPQLGDTVVYVPRAHYDTVAAYESPHLDASWESFPVGVAWPVVRCCVRHIRYRFPFKGLLMRNQDGHVTKNRSLVAILNLEVTGVPEQNEERNRVWPKPTFVAPPQNHVFEARILVS